MRTSLSILGFLVLTSVGCAATAQETSEPAVDEMVTSEIDNVAAVEIADLHLGKVVATKTVGAPKKVASIVHAVAKRGANEAIPRCIDQDTVRLTYLDARGKSLATVDTFCAGYGDLSLASGAKYGVKFTPKTVETAKNAPFAVGDALWPVTTIEVSRPGTGEEKKLEGAAASRILAGFDLDSVPNPNVAVPRCLPTHAVAFKRANAVTAYAAFLCDDLESTMPSTADATFTATDPASQDGSRNLAYGVVAIDPRPIIDAVK